MLNAKTLRRIATAVIALAAAATVTGCAAMDPAFEQVKGKASNAIQELATHQLDGWEMGTPAGGSYSIDYKNPNYSFALTTKSNTRNLAEACRTFIAYGTRLGATAWYNDPDYVSRPLQKYEAQAQIACVHTLNYLPASLEGELVGTGSPMFGLRGTYAGKGTVEEAPIDMTINVSTLNRTAATEPVTYLYSASVSTTYGDNLSGGFTPDLTGKAWNDSLASMDTGRQASTAVLDAIAAYRKNHHGTNPYSSSAVAAALTPVAKTYPKYTLQVSKSPDGTVHRIHLSFEKDSMLLPMCISITTYDPAFTGVADPGFGYTVGYVEHLDSKSPWGVAQTGDCPTGK